jgi:hypothetical protein
MHEVFRNYFNDNNLAHSMVIAGAALPDMPVELENRACSQES